MILTVTLNPLLERRIHVNSFEPGGVYRSSIQKFAAGGKGINVSRQLNLLGMKNSAFTFLGGSTGKQIRSILAHEQIDYNSVGTKSETRSAYLIIEEEKKRLTTIFGANGAVSAEEVAEFKEKLDKMIQNCSIVVFSGSSPSDETNGIFPFGIELANNYDKISILDTYGPHLNDCLAASPTVVHNNISEVENSLNIKLVSDEEKIEYFNLLYSRGIKLAFLTDGPRPFIAAKFDFRYKVFPPQVEEVDSTGSGDSFVAGVAYGIENSLVFDEFIKLATALGAANAEVWETCAVERETMERLAAKVKVEPLGKRMKLIDDSPKF